MALPFGATRAMFWKVMTGGYAGGTAGDSLGTGAGSGAYVVDNVKGYNPSIPARQTVEQTGGNKRLVRASIGDALAAPFTVSMAAWDTVLNAMLVGGARDTTNSEYARSGVNSYNEAIPTMGMAFTRQYFAAALTSTSYTYVTDIWLRCTIEPQPGSNVENAFADTTLQITPNYSAKDLTGLSFSESARMTPRNGYVDWYTIESTNPIHIYTFKASGTGAQTMTLPYKPLSSVVTINATTNELWRNGATEAATSASTSTGEVVTATGANNDLFVVIYETNFVATS